MGYTLTRTLTTHVFSTRSLFNTPPVLQRVLFSVFYPLDKTIPLSLVSRSDYNVYESRDRSCQLMKSHAVTTLFNSLAATVPKFGNRKACLIDRNKKGETMTSLAMLQCIDT